MINNDWNIVLNNIFSSNGFKKFMIDIKKKYEMCQCFPECPNIFNALKLTPYNNVKVVILGQDPYHNVGQAHGLSFSVQDGIAIPPSLLNIFKELKNDIGVDIPKNGDLTHWAKEGVLLLNSILTVEAHKPLSHSNLGWEKLTDYIIEKLNDKKNPVVFILWGSAARSKKKLITNPQHLIIESVHPSPLSAYNGFFGSKPFSKTNEFLEKNGIEKINW